MIFTRTIDSHLFSVECDASLQPAAEDVFDTLSDLAQSGVVIRDGLHMRFGWSLLSLRSWDHGFRVCEPLFSGDAPNEFNPTLDITFGVIASQLQWLRRVQAEGTDVLFDQQVVLARNALTEEELFALRGEPTSPADSGWSIAPVPSEGGDIDMSDLHSIPVYRLVDSHPGLLSILTLPVGYLVRLHDDEVVDITDPTGNVRWQVEELSREP